MVKARSNRSTRKPKAVVAVVSQQPKRQPNVIQRVVRQVRRNFANTKQTNIGRALRAGGSALGGVFGMPNTGAMIGGGISRIFGQGDYRFERNTMFTGGRATFAKGMESTRIRHREFVMDIQSTTAFNCNAYQISPTNSTLFPWLSQFATNYTEYKFHGLVFTFNTTCGSAISSTNNALGVVGYSTLYNPALSAFGSKREAEDNIGCVSSVPSASFFHGIECKNGQNVSDRYYVQVRGVADPTDTKWFSLGNLNVFTSGMQAAGITLGEMWVSYDVEFMKPRILPVGAVTQTGSKLYSGNVVSASIATQSLGNQNLAEVAGNLGASYRGSDGQFTIPRGTASGYYYISCNVRHATASTYEVNSFFADTTNVALTQYFRNNTAGIAWAPESIAAAYRSYDAVIYKDDNEACSFRFQMTTASPAQFNSVDCTILKMSNSLFGLSVAAYLGLRVERVLFEKIVARLKAKGFGQVDEEEEKEDNPPPLIESDEGLDQYIF